MNWNRIGHAFGLMVLWILASQNAFAQAFTQRELAEQARKEAMIQAKLKKYDRMLEKIPYQPVPFYPLKGTYVMEIDGYMYLRDYKNTVQGVELVPIKTKYKEFQLDRVMDSRSIRVIRKDGGYVEGGFGEVLQSLEVPREDWRAGIRLDCPSEITALELRNLGLLRERLSFPVPEGPISVSYKINPGFDSFTGEIRQDKLGLDFKTEHVDFVSDHYYSKDFKYYRSGNYTTKQPKGGPNAKAMAKLNGWEHYIIVVVYQNFKPYANVYEIGKGWLNSIELVEKLFRRDVLPAAPAMAAPPSPVHRADAGN